MRRKHRIFTINLLLSGIFFVGVPSFSLDADSLENIENESSDSESYDSENEESDEEYYDCFDNPYDCGVVAKDPSAWRRISENVCGILKRGLSKTATKANLVLLTTLCCAQTVLAQASNSTSTDGDSASHWTENQDLAAAALVVGMIGSCASISACCWIILCKYGTLPACLQECIFPKGVLGGKGTWFSRTAKCCDCRNSDDDEESGINLQELNRLIASEAIGREIVINTLVEKGIERDAAERKYEAAVNAAMALLNDDASDDKLVEIETNSKDERSETDENDETTTTTTTAKENDIESNNDDIDL